MADSAQSADDSRDTNESAKSVALEAPRPPEDVATTGSTTQVDDITMTDTTAKEPQEVNTDLAKVAEQLAEQLATTKPVKPGETMPAQMQDSNMNSNLTETANDNSTIQEGSTMSNNTSNSSKEAPTTAAPDSSHNDGATTTTTSKTSEVSSTNNDIEMSHTEQVAPRSSSPIQTDEEMQVPPARNPFEERSTPIAGLDGLENIELPSEIPAEALAELNRFLNPDSNGTLPDADDGKDFDPQAFLREQLRIVTGGAAGSAPIPESSGDNAWMNDFVPEEEDDEELVAQ